MGETVNAFVGVIHGQGDTLALEVVDVELGGGTSFSGGVSEGELSGSGGDKVGGSVLVTESMSTDTDGLGPSGDGLGDLVENDGLSEDGSSEDVSDLTRGVRTKTRRKKKRCSGIGLTVPLGLRHISFNLNSLTRASSGVMVAHLTPTEYFLIASAESIVIWSLVYATYQRGIGRGYVRQKNKTKHTASRLSIPKS